MVVAIVCFSNTITISTVTVRLICEKMFPFGLQVSNLEQLQITVVVEVDPPLTMFGSENYAVFSKNMAHNS